MSHSKIPLPAGANMTSLGHIWEFTPFQTRVRMTCHQATASKYTRRSIYKLEWIPDGVYSVTCPVLDTGLILDQYGPE